MMLSWRVQGNACYGDNGRIKVLIQGPGGQVAVATVDQIAYLPLGIRDLGQQLIQGAGSQKLGIECQRFVTVGIGFIAK